VLHAELAEIDENLIREELTALQQAVQLARRKEIYEALPENQQVKHGKHNNRGNQYTGKKVESPHRADFPQPERFTKDTAKKTGKPERTIQRKAKIGKTLTSVADKLKGTVVEVLLSMPP
jgi:ParB family transcriptional regulator, chromosome partitioning protein